MHSTPFTLTQNYPTNVAIDEIALLDPKHKPCFMNHLWDVTEFVRRAGVALWWRRRSVKYREVRPSIRTESKCSKRGNTRGNTKWFIVSIVLYPWCRSSSSSSIFQRQSTKDCCIFTLWIVRFIVWRYETYSLPITASRFITRSDSRCSFYCHFDFCE